MVLLHLLFLFRGAVTLVDTAAAALASVYTSVVDGKFVTAAAFGCDGAASAVAHFTALFRPPPSPHTHICVGEGGHCCWWYHGVRGYYDGAGCCAGGDLTAPTGRHGPQ